jgi:outer membrane protein insertion porin family
MKKLFFISILILICSVLYAAKIDEVRIKGNKRVPESRISQFLVKPGDVFDLEKIDESIRDLYKTGLFLNVSVDLEVEEEKVVVIYNFFEKPFINRIYIEGNIKISEDSLKEELVVKEGEPFDKNKIEETVKKLRTKYQKERFYDVKINYDIEELGNNAVDLIFSIDEGKKARVYDIKFIGNKFFKDKKLKKVIETKEKGIFSWLTGSGKLVTEELALDRERIRATYLNAGFMKVKVGDPEIIFNEDKTKMTVVFRIVEGDRYKVENIDITGNVHLDRQTLLDRLSLKPGDFFSSEKFQQDINKLTEAFGNIGYPFANVDPGTVMDDEKKTVSISYKIDEGGLYRIEKIIITGNEKSRDRVVRREFDIAEGEIYSSLKINKSRGNLQYTNFFEEVNIVEEPVSENKMRLRLNVKEKATGSFSIGAGYSTLDGIIGSLMIQKDNFLGLGYLVSLKGEFSTKRTDYTLSFTNRWLFDKPITVGFDIYNLKREYYEYTRKSIGGSLRLGHPLIGRKLYMHYRISYEIEDIYDLDDDASRYIREQQGKSTVVSFTPTISYNTTDHPLTPTRGNRSKAYVKIAQKILGGDFSYIRGVAESSQYVPLFWKVTGMVHLEAGYMRSLGGGDLPVFDRFRLGGMYSVRGFKYGDISPKDETGYDYGGNKYVLGNIETVFPISEAANLMGVLFFDVGQVYDNGENFFERGTRESAGFGFRWYSPIGPLRIEYGRKLDKKEGESSGRWDFSIGGMF